ncbi:MAG: hypothetical protein M3Z30_08340 [Gemmatimonadota bacterium]|nr:hypothetical protein [Gemmatimonadota bacterium]
MDIAFATSEDHRGLTEDDQRAVAALSDRGARVSATVWNDSSVVWSAFDCIVVRSTWDYHRHVARFREWIGSLEKAGAPLWNPPALLRWNMEKTYLRDLELAGVRIVPTAWLSRGTASELGALLEERGWHDAVVKPVISAAANRTHRIGRADAASSQSQVTASLEIGDLMVQPFIPEIQTRGEWSLIFLDGEFSHSVRKTPMSGDFRVQAHLGGDATTEAAGTDVIASARKALDAVESPWLYARVDGIETANGFVLVELEMLEPSLYLVHTDSGAGRFADAIIKRAGA